MKKTIDAIKKKRQVSPALKAKSKEYVSIKRNLLKSLKKGPKTIIQLSGDTGLSPEKVTYYLMSLRKFGEVETGEPDDMDEYYFYHLKTNE